MNTIYVVIEVKESMFITSEFECFEQAVLSRTKNCKFAKIHHVAAEFRGQQGFLKDCARIFLRRIISSI